MGSASTSNGELMDFILIHPAGLRAVWPDVRAGLDTMPKGDWIPEDVFHAIKSGSVALYLGANESGYAGFFVMQQLTNEYTNEQYLHCWLAYNHGDAKVYDDAAEFMKSLAKQRGFKRLTFGSPRPGWGKRFACTTAIYEIPLED